ncbi:unnamed protein product [Eruca vesicaria subsp. sativa]|uniref:Uncharacterized protein n=1 Tax=Eruca vesicaria subsp. sativa TaxID=29727 RepID=A0ABC8JT63_ERUVS|nr:unnamed protein product [Eruca vesicaria subsp. sativa]
MALFNIFLSDMRSGRCSDTVEVRLLRFWEARNVRKGGELMSVDMLDGYPRNCCCYSSAQVPGSPH